MIVRIAFWEDLDQFLQMQFDLGMHCILCLFDRQLVFKILENLPYALMRSHLLQWLSPYLIYILCRIF